ncbi:MAG: aspartate/glutamate racemase family protein [Gaiellaceae bacterium]
MRLRGVPPLVLEADELARRQAHYATLAPAPLEVEMVNLSQGPRRLETDEDVRLSEEEVYNEVMRTPWREYDGVLLDCVLDPALERLEHDAPVPVIGITRVTAGYLAGIGHRFAAVARNGAIARELGVRLRDFGHSERLAAVEVLDLSFEAIARPESWHAALEPIVAGLGPGAIDSVLNGCSAVEVRSSDGPSVVEPMALALELTAAAVRRGLLSTPDTA